MPDRKRYYITNDGRASLVEASKRLLSSFEWHYMDLNVGLETSDLLTHEEIVECMMIRLAKVQSNKKILKNIYLTGERKNFKENAVIKNLIIFREAEEDFLLQFLKDLA
jgi:hypothetical protein